MDKIITRRYRSTITRRRGQILKSDPTREEVKSAVDEFLSKGGKITRIEPVWIEDGSVYVYD
jgi:hypothetical protein